MGSQFATLLYSRRNRSLRRGRSLHGERSGAVAVIVAFTIIPIMMLVGLVVDLGWVLQAKSDLDLTADAAALAAVRTAASGYVANQSQATYIGEAQLAALQWWQAQSGSVPEVTSSTCSPVIVQTGQTIKVTINYTAQVYEILPKIFRWTNPNTGSPNANIANSSTASITVQAYGTIDFLLDNTSSMMLPATDQDLALLQGKESTWLASASNRSLVGGNPIGWNPNGGGSFGTGNYPLASTTYYCAFACHWESSSTATNPTDFYGLARQVGEKLRFDEVQSATVTAIQQMETLEQTNGQLSVGVFAFGGTNMTSPSYLSTIFAEAPLDPTVNGVSQKSAGGAAAIAALQNISPPVSGDIPNTNVGIALSDTLAITGPGGTGNTAASPLKSLILVTDGIEDDTTPQSIPSTEGPIRSSVCTAMKNAGYTVYVLYTPYNSEQVYVPNSYALIPYITGASSPSVLSSLQSCASSVNDVIVANSSDDIQAGMTTLIDEAVGATTRFIN
jgi:Flp pilus assembly protein TadG